MSMSVPEIEKAAQKEFDQLKVAVRFGRQALMSSKDEHLLLVDGSMYSPSTRAIGGSETIWQRSYGDPDAWHTYDEALNDLIESYDESGWSMAWHDGCLFLYSPDYNFEKELA